VATQCVQDIVCKSAVEFARVLRIFVAASHKVNVYGMYLCTLLLIQQHTGITIILTDTHNEILFYDCQ
jgi:hypothetical protein